MRIDSFLEQSPFFQTTRIARKLESVLNAALAREGLTLSESLMLAAIFLEKKGVRPAGLACTFETTRGNVSHTLSSLEAKRLVRRRIDPEDARGFRIELEPAGRRRAARVAAVLDRLQSRLEQELGAARLEAMIRQMKTVEQLTIALTQEGS